MILIAYKTNEGTCLFTKYLLTFVTSCKVFHILVLHKNFLVTQIQTEILFNTSAIIIHCTEKILRSIIKILEYFNVMNSTFPIKFGRKLSNYQNIGFSPTFLFSPLLKIYFFKTLMYYYF